jgi:hypothetical protein
MITRRDTLLLIDASTVAASIAEGGEMQGTAQPPRVVVKTTHAFDKPGTYFPVLRAISQRQDAVGTPFARVQNIGRVRVVVT